MVSSPGIFSAFAGLMLVGARAAALNSRGDGSIDMVKLCHQQFGDDTTPHSGATAFDWTCDGPNGHFTNLSVQDYCVKNYGARCFASTLGNGPFDWICFYFA